MNSVIVIGILALMIGALVSAVVVLYLDSQSWDKKLKAVRGDRDSTQAKLEKLQANLNRNEKKLAVAKKEIEKLSENVQTRDGSLSKLDTEKTVLQSKLDSADEEIDTLNDNLNQVNNHVNELREEMQELQNSLQASSGQNLLLQENVERFNAQLEAVRIENLEVCQKLAVAEVEMAHLKKSLEDTQHLEERVDLLQEEKNVLAGQLSQAQEQVADLKAQVNGSLQQVTETQLLRKRLLEAETNLKASEKQSGALQKKLTAVQSTLDYTGEGQLQIIRGIGPAYANRLQEIGIHTLNDLAKSKPQDISDALQLKPWQSAQPEGWIQEAKALTANLGKEETSADLDN
jgi:chromosome segregation ATPase